MVGFILLTMAIFQSKLICCTRDNNFNRERGNVNLKEIKIDASKIKLINTVDYLNLEKTEDKTYLISVIRAIDRIKETEKNITITDISNEIILKIKEELKKILILNSVKIDKMINNIINKVFEKIDTFSEKIYTNEGPKDKLLFCFLLKRIHSLLTGVKLKKNKISPNIIGKNLSYSNLISGYCNNVYTFSDDTFRYIPNFNDQTLSNSVQDILNYIKSCFFAYSIFIANKVIEVFPMLSIGEMNIFHVSKTIFDNEVSNKDISFFFQKMEKGDKNNEIAYIYRQILNSRIDLNCVLYSELQNIMPDVNDENKDSKPICSFKQDSGKSSYLLEHNEDRYNSYKEFFNKISDISKHKLYDSILNVYKTKLDLSKYNGGDEKIIKLIDVFKGNRIINGIINFL